jgi:hypothetical protein
MPVRAGFSGHFAKNCAKPFALIRSLSVNIHARIRFSSEVSIGYQKVNKTEKLTSNKADEQILSFGGGTGYHQSA